MLHIVDVSKEYIAVIFTVEEFTLVLEYMGLEDTGTTIFWKASSYLPVYVVYYPRRPESLTPQSEPHTLHCSHAINI
jgi:hypothetical protein